MSNGITASRPALPPVCLTFAQLKAAVEPLTVGNRWAEDTIGDLWRMGSPMPPALAGSSLNEEVRLLVPSAFMEWITDVLERSGRPLDAAANLYAAMIINGS